MFDTELFAVHVRRTLSVHYWILSLHSQESGPTDGLDRHPTTAGPTLPVDRVSRRTARPHPDETPFRPARMIIGNSCSYE
jgi:hypothetical protein